MADTIQTISVDGIKYNLRRLQELGVIRRVGPDKGGYWEVLKP
jgi:ATP-dependent DNA helicase RecG